MLLLFWILLFLAGACILLLMPSMLGHTIYDRHRGPRSVTCPETHGPAEVEIDALHAAFTGMASTEKLRLASCTLWPQRAGCAEACIAQAVAAPVLEPVRRAGVRDVGARIHLPAYLVATAAFWFIGLFWYSQYLFRSWWMSLMGFSEADLRRIVEFWGPHLVTVGIAVLFTFALAWVMALFDCHTIWRGLGAGFLLWMVVWVVMVGVVLFRQLPLGFIWLHGGYTLVASLAAGTILGGWKKGKFLRWVDREEVQASEDKR
jgi:hypothetical protein